MRPGISAFSIVTFDLFFRNDRYTHVAHDANGRRDTLCRSTTQHTEGLLGQARRSDLL